MFIKKGLVVLVSCFLVACATGPGGRNQVAFLPDAELNKMGEEAFEAVKVKTPVSHNTRANDFVNCVANSIIQQVGGRWEVVVFDDASLNAFALPGNKIGVYTGLVDLVDNQSQLATVIGHEIGHVLARHSNERLSQESLIKQGISVVGVVSGPQSALGQLGVSALGMGAQYGVLLPYSRTHESEADTIGMDFMSEAGFDPQESINLWRKMARASRGTQQAPEFMSTHPAHATRIEKMTNYLPKALQKYSQATSAGIKPNCTK
ncbi:MAG: M48 family metallopeptidase [Methylococcales bacterium]|nr:M48 family metallopeptidase [Methylococcales bacterium]